MIYLQTGQPPCTKAGQLSNLPSCDSIDFCFFLGQEWHQGEVRDGIGLKAVGILQFFSQPAQ